MSERCTAVPRFAAECGIVPADVDAMRGEMRADQREIRSLQRDAEGAVTGEETMRGLRSYFFTTGGRMSLYAAPRGERRPRLLIARGPFEALCAAACEGHREDTIYAAPPGRLVERAQDALLELILQAEVTSAVVAVSKTDDLASDICDLIQAHLGTAVTVEYLEPPSGTWSASLRVLRRRAAAA